ncbi:MULTISPECIES: hypothetical protein [Chryseobacterium]|uniref:Prevent-host-death protein n=1 Tax=Chryseobacterium camelliae TaxID=1265445 RepID=A0ABU0TLZ2_9FLAO|nr:MULTISPECIES: hypothetical protein [Chryseobacterium]MDT3408129.1 hypothetical protein [Pseudacidovorax intermedius]MDQ1098016.1 hypothetical protein [Chryseobacterium camelliae]MDQ1101944.1 hypothetical protein [Chryseobacterium sp. SORGH_AS_1048]MDR6085384.1 hypothetical protein [Chryseobacterium sp. SORGH_AS_0909]MDR6129745.1 hypothetical protein [Chryseobacterium sp. SORGH_AS_1175]
MSTITIHLKNKEEETFMENLLQRTKISFEKNEDDALKQDRSETVDGKESLKRSRAKYGL